MGILKPHIHLFCMEQKRTPIIKGDLLTLGQQSVFSTLADVKTILAFHGLPIKELPSGFDTASKIPSWKGTQYESNPNAQTVFTLLGAERVYATDGSTYENPDFVINLNEPVDVSYYERFDTIVDVGTLEHVFDIATALKNVVRMCRAGGSIILMNPSSGAIDHGFYQFSPTLYFDYFASNGFSVVSCYLDEPLRYDPIDERKGHIYKYEYVDDELPIVSSTGFGVAFFAKKQTIGEADGSVKPIQSLYRNAWNANQDESSLSDETVKIDSTARKAAKRAVPWIRLILRLRFITVAKLGAHALLDRKKTWQPLWLNRYLFKRKRGKNIRYVASYSASGDIRLRHPDRPRE